MKTIDKIKIMLEAPSRTLIDAYRTFLKEMLEECEKYRWHDLRKDPKDLPDDERTVTVMAKMFCPWDDEFRFFELKMNYCHKILRTGKVFGWKVGYPYFFNFETDEVIAWREIEPFEEDKE